VVSPAAPIGLLPVAWTGRPCRAIDQAARKEIATAAGEQQGSHNDHLTITGPVITGGSA
jgi:hypothetical protein